VSIRAHDGLDLVVFHDVQPVNIFLVEAERVALVHQLHLVRYVVGADLLGLEQADITLIFADMEVPYSENLLTEAVDRLISLNFSR